MSGLFDSLSTASNALLAQRMGLDVVGQNMANINTPGYARRVLDLAEVPPTDPMSAGRGVSVEGVRALRDQLVEARLRREQGDTARDSAMSEIISAAESAIGLPGQSLDADLAGLFDAFSAFTQDPTSVVARDTVVRAAQKVTGTFARLSGQFTQIQNDADRAIRSAMTDVNAITAEIAKLNKDIAIASYDVETVRDRQSQLLADLNKLTDIQVLQRADGAIDVTLSSGHALVIGGDSFAVTQSPNGLTTISIDGANVTSAFTSGRIGGLLAVRDTTIPGYLANLDQIAFDLAGAVNAIHVTGFDGNGAAAGVFFSPLSGVQGAAQALAVDPAIVADPTRVAASATGAAGDNAVALQLAALRNGLVAQGGTRTLVGSWSQLAYSVGSDAAASRAATTSHAQVVTQLEQLRAQTSGVSYDEEAAHLMRYQRAYEANARYFQTILNALDALMEMVR